MRTLVVLLPVIGIMTYATFLLWEDYQKRPDIANFLEQDVIGRVISKDNNVKRRSGNNPLWYNLSQNEALLDRDLIKTGFESNVHLELSDKTNIRVDANSLIVLEKRDQIFEIDFKLGEINASSNENLNIRLNDHLVNLNNADLTIRTDINNNSQIEVTKGEVRVSDKENRQIQIQRNQQLEIDPEGRVRTMQTVVLLSSPEHLARIKDPRSRITYPFTWAVLRDGLNQQIFQLSDQEDFPKNRTWERRAHQAIEAPVQQGLNFWRVGWLTTEGGQQRLRFTSTRKFFLDPDDSIIIQSPQNQSRHEFLPDDPPLRFDWSSRVAAKQFMLEVSRSADFRSIYKNKMTKDNFIFLDDLESGQYYFRIRAFDENNTLLGMSQTRTFLVSQILPRAPDLIQPIAGFRWSMNEPIPLQWKEYAQATNYHLMISKDLNFQNIVFQQSLQDTQINWRWTEAGTYFWQVYITNSENQKIANSVVERFEIQPSLRRDSIELVVPLNQATIAREREQDNPPIVFEWASPIRLAPNYRWSIARNSDFSDKSESLIVNSTKHLHRLNESGTYFWKVEWLDNKNEVKYVSPIYVFQYLPTTSLAPTNLLLPVSNSVFYTSTRSDIEFQWEDIDGAQTYKLTLYRLDTDGEPRIMSQQKSPTNIITIRNLRAGHYLWDVQGLDKENFEGTKSNRWSFQIQIREGLEAPRLRDPVVR